jgi:hypothetical protein
VLNRVTADGCETNELTWLVALQMLSLPKRRQQPKSSDAKSLVKRQCASPIPLRPAFASHLYICEHILRVEMPRRLIRPDDAHYGFVMRHCQLHELLVYFEEASKIGAAGSSVWTSLLAAQGSAKDREIVFKNMLDAGIEPKANTWSSLMAGYNSGVAKENVIVRMAQSGMQPNAFAWSAVIAA